MNDRLALSIEGSVRLLRLEAGLSLQDLADKAGRKPEEIEKIEGLIDDLDDDTLSLEDWEIFQILGDVLNALGKTLREFNEHIKAHNPPDATLEEIIAKAEPIAHRIRKNLSE